MTTPQQVTPLTSEIASLGAGDFHAFAVTLDGALWGWGSNTAGQVGDGATEDVGVPKEVATSVGPVSLIRGGAVHTVAVKTDGTIWAWGDNSAGALGDGTTTNRMARVAVPGKIAARIP